MCPARRATSRTRGRVSRPALVLGAVVLLATATAPWSAERATAQSADCPPPTAAEVEAIARDYFAAFNTGDAAALDALLAPDYQHHGSVVADQDRELHKERMLAVREGFPDRVFTIDWLLVDGDTAVVRHTFRGTHEGEFVGVPASGNPVAVGAFHVHRIACGQIVETWNAADGVGLFRQMGVLASPPTTAADQETAPPASAPRASCPQTTPAQNAALARRWYDEMFNQRRLEVLNELLADDVVHHGAMFVDVAGRENVAGIPRALLAGYSDLHFNVDDVIAAGDTVLIRWSGGGTQDGTFLGMAPTGIYVDMTGMNAFRFDCGRIVESWSETNSLEQLRQVGALR